MWLKSVLVLTGLASTLFGAESGSTVVVVYNSRLPASKDVAIHYAERRNVPLDQVLGLDLPTEETMSRPEYRDQLQHPLLQFLVNKNLQSSCRSTGPRPSRPAPKFVTWRSVTASHCESPKMAP